MYHGQIQNRKHANQMAEGISQPERAPNEISPMSLITQWKEHLREEICNQPGEALKFSLLAGLFAGWWVKR
ncbi:hypothetical protein Pan161_18850 [Gimesia algae]|uniref:Uncharacterized protein n=1 Tax=Gimesia algae TaxID=2527971 RepID=A0A517VB51_9PLAN|nr:hypothetical protein Pan161_18850 [Gimesia algae]